MNTCATGGQKMPLRSTWSKYRCVITDFEHSCKDAWLIFLFFVLLPITFPHFLLSVLLVTLSPGSGKNSRTKRRRAQGSLGVWAGGFVGQPAGHTKTARKRERKRGTESLRGVSMDWDMGLGAAEVRGGDGERRRLGREERSGVNSRSCFVIHSSRTFALTAPVFYSAAPCSVTHPSHPTPTSPDSIHENFKSWI